MSVLIPILSAAGVPALIAVLAILRGWSIARALVLLLASVVAIVTTKEERRAACTEIVDMVTRKDEPPGWLRCRPVRVIDQPVETSTSSVPATPPVIVPELLGTSVDATTFTK